MLWNDKYHIGQAFRNIEWLESLGKQVFFVTNNATISRESMAQKMKGGEFQYQNVKLDHLYPSTTIAAQYVKQFLPGCSKVRFMGSEAMGEELISNGLVVNGDKDDPHMLDREAQAFKFDMLASYKFDEDVGAVITGLDYGVNY